MQKLNGKRVVITGGSQGLGLAMVEALAACGANVTAISRDRAKLAAAEQAGAAVIAGDATDVTLMNSVVREEAPDVICAAGGATTIWVDFPKQKALPLPDWLRTLVSE